MKAEGARYLELAPSPRLAPYVECYWLLIALRSPHFLNRIWPDNCADIIVDLSSSLAPAGIEARCRAHAIGTMRKAARVRLARQIHMLGVRL